MAYIKWKQGDYISLGKAVSQFNKKIRMIETEENKFIIPKEVNYKELKKDIVTRKELNRVIKSLKRFSEAGAEDIYTLKSGEQITKWERKELQKQINIASSELRKSARVLEKPISSGYSKAQMGSIEYRQILANLRSIKNLELKRGGDFISIKDRIKKFGNYDYTMIKATIYRENYMKALEESGIMNFENYRLLEKKFNRIKNPINFFNFIQNSNVMSDLFLYYKEGYGMAYNFSSDEERFNYGLEELGLLKG